MRIPHASTINPQDRGGWREGRPARRPRSCRPLVGSALLLVALLLIGCARPVRTFDFTVDGRPVDLYLQPSPSHASGTNGPYYAFARPVAVEQAGQALFVRYAAASGGGALSVYLDHPAPGSGGSSGAGGAPGAAGSPAPGDSPAAAEPMLVMELPRQPSETANSGDFEVMVPITEGASVRGFGVEPARDAATPLVIRAAGIGPLDSGVSIGARLTVIPAGFSYADSGGSAERSAAPRVQTIDFTAASAAILAAHPHDQVQLVVSYSFDPAASPGARGDVTLDVLGSNHARSYRLTPNPGSHEVFLYSASCGFAPESLRVSSSDPSFMLNGVSVKPFDASALGSGVPIPADFGAILQYSPRAWRTADFELFEWSLVPHVLVFDFRSYDIQARYLSRFAYFIEKKGFAGRLLSNAELGKLHGWNAHDYRPEDIASFYQTAQDEHFTLRPEEYELRDLLAKNGIIRESGGTWRAGEGAILSVAQSSWYGLRSLLLTHEGYHGIFFTNARYRDDVFALWSSLPAGERQFWRLFLGSQDYNTSDDYLVVNEFQAYLMQQTVAQVDARYKGWAIGELAKQFPAQARSLEQMIGADPTIFADTARRLDEALYRDSGTHAGLLVTLQPVQE